MKKNNAVSNTVETKKETKKSDLLEMYREQTVIEGKHDRHIDGYTYGDYSDSCCC